MKSPLRNRKNPVLSAFDMSVRHWIRNIPIWIVLFCFLSALPYRGSGQSVSSEVVLSEKMKQPRFRITTAGIYAFLNTNLRFESPNGLLGVKINMEDNLGLDKSEFMFVGSFLFNIKNRHNIYGMYYNLPRKVQRTTQQDIEYDTIFIPAGTGIKAYFNTTVYSLGYLYNAVYDSRSRLGFFVNFYVLTVASGVSSDLSDLNENFRITAPLPNFGLMFEYQIGKRWYLGGNYGFFFLKIGNYKGSINNLGLNLDFRTTKWLNIELGYYVFSLNIEAEEKKFTGIVDYTFQGPFIGTTFQF